MKNKQMFWQSRGITSFKNQQFSKSVWWQRLFRFLGALFISQLPLLWFIKLPRTSSSQLAWTLGLALTSIFTIYILTRWYLKVRPKTDTFTFPKRVRIFQIIGFVIIMWLISTVVAKFLSTTGSSNVSQISSSLEQAKVGTILYAGLFAPIIEELTYRGLFTSCVGDKLKTYQLILASGFVFGLMHGFPLIYFMSKFLFGMIACYLYRRDKSLVSDCLFHLLNNSTIFLMLL